MLNYWQIGLVLISTIIIGIADAVIKKVSGSGSIAMSLKNPLLLVPVVLYLVQILMIVYIFSHKADLAIYGNIFIVFYSVTTVLLGLLVFKEQTSFIQVVGIVLALIGAVLINRH